MSPKKPGPYLLKSRRDGLRFKTGEAIPQSGLYSVHHHAHRLPPEVDLYKDQFFPRCQRCEDSVSFELLRAEPAMDERPEDFRIYLFELPQIQIEEAHKLPGSEPAA